MMNNRSSNPIDNAAVDPEEIETAKWTRYLPEAFGIRATVQKSKYRWCAREAAMWGIATGTAMTLHRLRMKSTPVRSINVGYLSLFVVYTGSYYFCYRRRDHQEKMIELMMKLNYFEHASDMPDEIPLNEQHPFVIPKQMDDDHSNNADGRQIPAVRQYVAKIPERKEWQTQLPTQDAADVFRPVGIDETAKSSSSSTTK